jgi:hypothetical protein
MRALKIHKAELPLQLIGFGEPRRIPIGPFELVEVECGDQRIPRERVRTRWPQWILKWGTKNWCKKCLSRRPH